jgi:hypothetical protein
VHGDEEEAQMAVPLDVKVTPVGVCGAVTVRYAVPGTVVPFSVAETVEY